MTWVLDGAVEHSDAEGRTAAVRPGTVQVQSAGSGIVHREVAAAGAGPTRFVQVWLTPDETGAEPSYATAEVTLPDGELVPVASGHRDDAAVRIGTAVGDVLGRADAGGRRPSRCPRSRASTSS